MKSAAVLLTLALAAPALAAEGPPKIEKTSVLVSAVNRPKDETTYVWTPKVQFKVYGQVPADAEFAVDFQTPDGKPWISMSLPMPDVEAGTSAQVEGGGHNVPVEKGIAATGDVPFTIKLGDKVLFKGTAEVKKFHVNGAIPKYKDSFYYYVDEDWRLPVGEMWWNPKEDPDAPPLLASFWVRGGLVRHEQGTLWYQGKQFCSTAARGQGDLHEMNNVETSLGHDKQQWTQVVMYFGCARATNKHAAGGLDASFHVFDKKPGHYELKLLRDGKVMREAEFTIGDDGKIVDTGLADKNDIGGRRMLFAARISGDTEGKYDAMAWKKGIYGNPLAGFQP